jgi:hypothetical protein
MNPSPEKIEHLEPNEVFVFGSNLAGRHGRGAAKIAQARFGARPGHGLGLSGQSYGIATKGRSLRVLSLERIRGQVYKFIRFAVAHPELTFLVTPIGCGLAGYKPKDIAPMFMDCILPDNIRLPKSFLAVKSK